MIDDLVVRTAEEFRKKSGIHVLTGHRAEVIDRTGRMVKGIGPEDRFFQIPYDRLLIATGASPIVPERAGFDLPGLVVVKTLEDTRAIKARLQSGRVKAALIVGMGYIAMEMAEALRAWDVDVTMVKPRTEFLPWMDPELAECVRRELTTHQVTVRTGFAVDRIVPAGNGFEVFQADGESLRADMVVVAAGIRPNSALAAAAGLALGPAEAIAVDRQLRTTEPMIYAAGDCADAFHVVGGQRTWIPLALRANRAGWAVADHVCGKEVALQGIAGTAVFKVFDLQVARTGLNAMEAVKAGFEPTAVTITSASRAHSYPGGTPLLVHMVGDKRSGRLLGVQMAGREGAVHRINAPAVALHAKMTVEQFSQSDLAYAPPFGPTWDPLLVAANQLIKNLL